MIIIIKIIIIVTDIDSTTDQSFLWPDCVVSRMDLTTILTF